MGGEAGILVGFEDGVEVPVGRDQQISKVVFHPSPHRLHAKPL